jgi:hypothetical protein
MGRVGSIAHIVITINSYKTLVGTLEEILISESE